VIAMVEIILGLIVSIFLLAYLLYALFNAEEL
jgi:K+-transporting ATPase KdpF subunit